MKQKLRRLLVICILGLLTIGLLFGCCAEGKPGIEAAEEYLNRDLDDLQRIIQWMQSTKYKSIAFWRNENFMLAELEHLSIDESIRPTLNRLYKNGYQFISMRIEENTVVFKYWSRTIGGRSCGLAYVLDGENLPEVQFMTESKPLSVKGWYYYFSDYEEWRVTH